MDSACKSHRFRVEVIADYSRGWAARMTPPGFTGDGGIAQLVEHELCKLGATGSNPVASTFSGV